MKPYLTFVACLSILWAACVTASAQEVKQACPEVTVSCPDLPGKSLSFKANVVGGDPTVKPTYTWKVSGGKIAGGQGTAEITVDAEGGSSFTATVEVGGYVASCQTTNSCSLFICPAPSPRMVDEFGDITPGQEESRLDSFAEELRNDPSAQGYIVVYAGGRGSSGEAAGRAGRLRSYLVRRHDLEPERVVAVAGGKRESFSVELWVVPAGATPPKGTSTPTPRAKHNNGMHPTPHQRASHVRCAGARVMPGVRCLFTGVTVMRDGQCPKCNAQEVHLMDGPYADMVSVPLSWTGKAKTSYYICARCGYLEVYIRDESDLPKIAQKWPKVRPEGG